MIFPTDNVASMDNDYQLQTQGKSIDVSESGLCLEELQVYVNVKISN